MAGAKGATAVLKIDARWVDGWIAEMKQVEKLAPATIRAKIGATALSCAALAVRLDEWSPR